VAADQIADAVTAAYQLADDGQVRVHVAGRGRGDDGDVHCAARLRFLTDFGPILVNNRSLGGRNSLKLSGTDSTLTTLNIATRLF
jgi:hypothetical protein